ncbi:MAG: 30S ribosomal protein S1 [Synechococcales cyanobacterium T60_A2020_003]|nr:30S ribosomal protein S1 [Synechococcales cyanobacterium T60_A2020_003]
MSFSSDDFAKALEQYDYQFQRGQVIRGKIFSHESEGAYVDVGGKAAAFLPKMEASLSGAVDLTVSAPLHEERDFLIIRDQDTDGQLTLSIRQLELRRIWEQFAEMQEAGQTIQVRVKGVNKGGVTVDAHGLRGFVPRSHLVDRDSLDVLVGKTLTVGFLEIDPNQRRLVLSQRIASQSASMGQLGIGQLVDGKISNIKPFGLFVDFNGVTGLLHINQISANYIASLPALFEIGQSVKAVIIDLDSAKRRVSLSTKVLEQYPGEILEKFAEVMAEAEARLPKAQKMLVREGTLQE